MDFVPEALEDAARIYRERNALYVDNYKRFGPALHALIGAVALTTPEDFNRFGILVQMFAKMSRYCQQFSSGGHPDSINDLAVYSMMLQELDSEARK